ncbi:hypothetical protein ET495_11140 [Xylanimonas allomyrinae]|uniref:Uncharacterized protein n=1 Tax=Xylanimonas allomyrinae TaxID=2509459 RepID=A0A4P6F062_9MICO|nr:hypothetical protein [Xylanimonas allomyrinae]QAY63708.1 hypothetical protein ET495_11140 [Xylanimonas allomyrinae]
MLFTHLREDLDGLTIHSTTNRIEGGCNHPVKDLLRRHRGMTDAHRRRAAQWWFYLHSTRPAPPATLIRPEHYKPPPTAVVIPDDEHVPGGYGTSATAEEGLWARTGWAGRSH